MSYHFFMEVAEYEKYNHERETVEVPTYNIYVYFWVYFQ